jgi:hypothetical protein
LDEDVEEGDALLYGICDCKATAVHHNCLEKLVNSKRRRRLPLEQRTACDVCLHPYAIRYETVSVEPLATAPELAVYRQPVYVRNPHAAMVVAFGLALAFKAITSFAGPRLVFVILGAFTLVILACVAHAASNRVRLRLRRDQPTAVDPLTLDDEAFYSRIFVDERAALEARAARATAEPPSSRAQTLILISDERLSGTRRRLASKEAGADGVDDGTLAKRSSDDSGELTPHEQRSLLGDEAADRVPREPQVTFAPPQVRHCVSDPLLGRSSAPLVAPPTHRRSRSQAIASARLASACLALPSSVRRSRTPT